MNEEVNNEQKAESINSIICDVCEEQIEKDLNMIKVIQVQIDKFKDGKPATERDKLEITYFSCPSCGTNYFISVHDKKSLTLKNELNVLLRGYRAYINKFGKGYGDKKIVRYQSKIQSKRKEYYNQQVKLVSKYNKSFCLIDDVKEQLNLRIPAFI